jgi:DNA-binding NarL/FixJ family response regulator
MQRSEFSVVLASGSEELRANFRAAQTLLSHWKVLALFDRGDRLITFLSGSGAYTNRKEHPLPNLLLLDVDLPQKAGLDVLAWMQGQELPGIGVVVLGDSPSRLDIRKALDLGAHFYQLKPRTADEFVYLMRALEPFLLRHGSS